MLLDEEHCREDDVTGRDVVKTFIEQLGILSPFRRRMERDPQTRDLVREHFVRAGDRTGEVTVQRHNNEAHGSATSD